MLTRKELVRVSDLEHVPRQRKHGIRRQYFRHYERERHFRERRERQLNVGILGKKHFSLGDIDDEGSFWDERDIFKMIFSGADGGPLRLASGARRKIDGEGQANPEYEGERPEPRDGRARRDQLDGLFRHVPRFVIQRSHGLCQLRLRLRSAPAPRLFRYNSAIRSRSRRRGAPRVPPSLYTDTRVRLRGSLRAPRALSQGAFVGSKLYSRRVCNRCVLGSKARSRGLSRALQALHPLCRAKFPFRGLRAPFPTRPWRPRASLRFPYR